MSTNERKTGFDETVEIVRRGPSSVTVVFRMTPGEKAQLREFAKRHDCTASDVLYTALVRFHAIEPAAHDLGRKAVATKCEPTHESYP